MLAAELPSIHALTPLEQGGPTARAGFLYQDHVAARFCIEMLRNPNLAAVWCETLDDITLLWTPSGGGVTVEFVQVKSIDLGQMWSIALICEGGKKSLVAHSLAQHRCHEPCCFRVVRPPNRGSLGCLSLCDCSIVAHRNPTHKMGVAFVATNDDELGMRDRRDCLDRADGT
jgi:Cap4, dsDNA endonuclease domain